MMRKKVTYTNITPIPSFIPRQLALDILHSHGEIIELNPLVTGFEPIKAPRDAPADEFYSTWYEISEKIQYIPGIGKLGSGNIKFKGCFHDMPWGLQTHIYAPANVDLRNNWRIGGNQPGEPPETRELGIGAPPEGLYLREDIEIKCNRAMTTFVTKETKAASKVLVDRLIRKAELLDAGVLHAMMEDGKLKTLNPADRSSQIPQSPKASPQQPYKVPMSPLQSPSFPPSQMDLQRFPSPKPAQGQNNVVMELPGDFYHPPSSPNTLAPVDNRYSTTSELSGQSPNRTDIRWSQASSDYESSRPTSYASDGFRSPGIDQKGFSSELPTMQETREEHEEARRRLEDQQHPEDQKYRYNPQDFANTHHYSQTQLQQQYGYPTQYATYQGR